MGSHGASYGGQPPAVGVEPGTGTPGGPGGCHIRRARAAARAFASSAWAGFVVLAVACSSESPTPVLMGVQPQSAYSDQQTRIYLHGRNFVPSFTLDLEQELRIPVGEGFGGSVQNPVVEVPLNNLTWLSPDLLQADLSLTTASAALPFNVNIVDPRGQRAQLANGFVSLGPDTEPPIIEVHEPSGERPLAPGMLLPVRFSAQDVAPGHLEEIQYKIKWREQLLVDGRCRLPLEQHAATTCALTAMVPLEARPRDIFEVTLVAVDGARAANRTTHTLRYELKPNPQILDVIPPMGSSGGGTDIVVRGLHFDPSSQVLIGGQLLLPDGGQWLDAQTITGRTPAAAPGWVKVELRSLTGGSPAGGYHYRAEVMIASVIPESAPGAGRVPLSIRGSSLTRETIIVFGDRPTSGAQLVNPNWVGADEIRGMAPPGVGSTFVWAVDPVLGKARWAGMFKWTTSTDGAM